MGGLSGMLQLLSIWSTALIAMYAPARGVLIRICRVLLVLIRPQRCKSSAFKAAYQGVE